MSSIGDRLREEREKLSLNQTQLAELTGTTRKTQFNYETDARRPDADYLATATSVGVDVLYVLTGQRVGGVKPAPTLNADEEELLALFRAAPLAVKAAAIGALHGAAGTTKTGASRSPRAKAANATTVSHNHGGLNIGAMHGQIVQGDVVNGVPVAGKTARGRRGSS